MKPIPVTTNDTGEKRSYILFNGVRKTKRATIPYVLSKIPVVSESSPISPTFKGRANASVPLLIISAKAAKDACKTNGCFIKPENCEKLNLPFSVETKLSLTNRSEEHTSELQSRGHLVCRLL